MKMIVGCVENLGGRSDYDPSTESQQQVKQQWIAPYFGTGSHLRI